MLDLILKSNVINFALVLGLFFFLWKKYNLTALIDKKIMAIKCSILSAQKREAEAKKTLQTAQQKTANIKEEKAQIIAKIKDEKKLVENKLQRDTELKLIKINKNTEKTIVFEREKEKKALEQELFSLALERCETNIKKSMNNELHTKLADDFIENLDGLKIS